MQAINPKRFFIYDASPLLISLLGLLYGLGLTCTMVLVLKTVLNKKQGDANYQTAKRNAIVYLGVSSFFMVVLAVLVVLMFLFMFGGAPPVDGPGGYSYPGYMRFRAPRIILETMGSIAVLASLLVYVGIPLVQGLRQKHQFSRTASAESGYVPLNDEQIPAAYDV